MEKILTVSVAGYNVENFIRQNLDSMTGPEIVDLLEVFVVDDGGTDSTLEIAKEYEERWPDTFHAVHKKNGGYGSTVNYSLAHATGKYFRMLDGDDWFDAEGIRKLVRFLQDTDADADAVATQFLSGDGSTMHVGGVLQGVTANQKYAINDFHVKNYIGMWSLTIKTDKLRESGLQLPEHTLYTDQYFCTIPFAVLETIQYCDYPVYCYRVGREEQSVSVNSVIKHYQEVLRVCRDICTFCQAQKELQAGNWGYILHRVTGYYRFALKAILYLPEYKESKIVFRAFENEIQAVCKDVYDNITASGLFGKLIRIARATNYMVWYPLYHFKYKWA